MYGAIDTAMDTREPWDNKKSLLQGIEADLLTLTVSLGKVGGSDDSLELRQSIRDLRTQLKRRVNEERMRQCRLLEQQSGANSGMSEQLKRESEMLQQFIGQLHHLMEEERVQLQRYPSPHHTTTTATGVEETDWGGTTAVSLLLPQSARQTEEDAQALEDIQRDIDDLNEIQRNLATLVQEQGQDIDVIEAHVGVAHARVIQGRRELAQAAMLKGSSRRKKLCIAVCVLVSVIIPLALLGTLVGLLIHFLA